MRPLLTKLTPVRGIASLLHYTLLVLLPIIVFVLLRLGSNFIPLAVVIILLSKWRMLAVRPRFWPANIRANAVDIMVGLSIVAFMAHAINAMPQFLWAVVYGVWLLWVKPKSSAIWVSAQAGIGQLAALTALFLVWADGPLYGLSLVTGLICYLAARHFFDSFDEMYARLLSYLWGYSGAALAWLLAHWLLFYGFLAQPTLLLTVLGYGLGAIYYFDHFDRLHVALRRQFIFIMIAIILLVLTFSDWGDKVV